MTETCGTHFAQMLADYGLTDPEAIRHVAIGHIHGLAAKVALGACPAAMVRPGAAYERMVTDIVTQEANRFGLGVTFVQYPTSDGRGVVVEYWLHRHDPVTRADLDWLQTHYAMPYSPLWHRLRGRLCGIPEDQLDDRYHERPGPHGACEPEEGV